MLLANNEAVMNIFETLNFVAFKPLANNNYFKSLVGFTIFEKFFLNYFYLFGIRVIAALVNAVC